MRQPGRHGWPLLVAFVFACAQIEIKPPEGELEFALAGRIAARYGAESFIGNIAWRHAKGGDELLISTPTGQGVAQIVRQGDAVLLRTAEQREYRAPDSEALTERVLGFGLPIEGLADWVRGRPSPELERRGWTVEYQEHDPQGRPTRMRVARPGVELRLAISQWN
jgi:outer membrane lipoprotein LolB